MKTELAVNTYYMHVTPFVLENIPYTTEARVIYGALCDLNMAPYVTWDLCLSCYSGCGKLTLSDLSSFHSDTSGCGKRTLHDIKRQYYGCALFYNAL